MTHDPTENFRRNMIEAGQPQRDLEGLDQYAQRWDTDQLRIEFDVLGFLAPFVSVRRKVDGVKGSMEFTHNPRVYFNFVPERELG